MISRTAWLIIALLFAWSLLFLGLYGYQTGFFIKDNFQRIDKQNQIGFESVDCWFSPSLLWPVTECYYLHVPENHNVKNGRIIQFPVIVFRSSRWSASDKSPVVHLGAGGPGAAMGFDSVDSVQTIWEYHDDISLKQGRDLYVIDPRGVGLSKPLLMCRTFVEGELKRLSKNLILADEWREVDKDYHQCIDDFKEQGVDLSAYNSLSVAFDIELMRKLASLEKLVLLGVSYGAVYAQIIANNFPQSVEAMILDSAAFPSIKPHDNFLERTLAPYRALYDYCSMSDSCIEPIENVEQRMWGLHEKLNQQPLTVEAYHPQTFARLPVLLNGERFVAALINGIYGEAIFDDLPIIIQELENGNVSTLMPYLQDYIYYLLDTSFGDISASSHYCYETKAFIDKEAIRFELEKLPGSYIKKSQQLSLDWPDYCEKMEVGPGGETMAAIVETDIPVLFLHGELDTVTPLSDVYTERKYYKNSRLITYPQSHDILSSSECAEMVAGKFVQNTAIAADALTCY